jgi:ABC-type multidrug transport system ATPase subunit
MRVFAGPNGSGKTTLLRIILGLIKSKSGSVKLFGKNMEAIPHIIFYFVCCELLLCLVEYWIKSSR